VSGIGGNWLLREIHLTIRDPKTDLPAVLLADSKNAENRRVTRFRLQVNYNGKSVKTSVGRVLPDLDLMEDPPRRESFARRVSNTQRSFIERQP